MKYTFAAKIYKVGINPCVKVPRHITDKMVPEKGYIPVKGKIGRHPFNQTLVPVRDASYRLYVNGPMLNGAGVRVGETVQFTFEQDRRPRRPEVPMNPEFKKQLAGHNLLNAFETLTASRKKDILKYLNHLKTEEALTRNIDKVLDQLRNKTLKRKYP
jgi:hypothetical protein